MGRDVGLRDKIEKWERELAQKSGTEKWDREMG